MKRVFISYDFRDTLWVENFVKGLEQNANSSLDLKIDYRSVQYGDNFLDWMDTCLKTADIFMPIISYNYVKNISFARLEYQEIILRSHESQKRIIPVFMEKVDIEHLPIGISSIRSFYVYVRGNLLTDLISSITTDSDPNFPERQEFIPSDRRIRVQVTSACNQNCDWCHNDEFEKNQTNASPKEIIDNLSKHFGNLHGTPRPRLEFAFTGGEPLTVPGLFFNLIQDIPPDILKNSFLLTNGRELNDKTQSRLRELGLLNIRITFSNLLKKPFYRRIRPSEGSIDPHFKHILNNIERISRDSEFKIRINHTLITDSQEKEISDTLSDIKNLFPRINHIAFIQKDQSDRDIFEIGKAWADGELASLNNESISPRINQYKWSGGVTVDFIKMNCHLVEKNRQRCLLCVLDKDISITSDGRIRLCYEQRKDDKCTYKDLHLDVQNPWKGISAAIRTQWATAGFYSHFEDLITQKETNVIPDFHLSRYREWIQKALESQNLYEEKFNNQSEALKVIELCGRFLDRAFEQFQKKNKTNQEKLVSNINLLILIYLCVDETLFSTGRTVMVQGIAFLILSKLKDDIQEIMDDDFQLSQLLLVTTYCIASVAMEKCSANIVKEYILKFSTEEEIRYSCMLSYILGCIERQQGNDKKAIALFKKTHKRSDLLIREPAFFDFLKPLLHEIHVESLRSLGVIYENSDPKKANERLQKAAFQSRIYGTKLQYTVTYSIGYYLMKSYFENNYPDMNHEVALDAHRAFSESLRQNSNFFPGLIRMGLLETGLRYYNLAAKRAKKARDVLKKKGLLTDLEYLNYWLNEMILSALMELNEGNINVTLYYYPGKGVTHCINAGMKDIICVHRDAKFLQKTLRSKRIKLRQLKQFLEDCQTLIRTKQSKTKGRIKYGKDKDSETKRKFEYGKDFDSKIPYSVVYAITESCNVNCIGCFAGKFDEPDSKLHIVHKIINILSDCGVRRVSFGGGEPTLHPQILDIIGYTHSKGLCTAMSTNGIKMADNQLQLKDFNGILNEIIIDYHSTNALISRKFAPMMDREHIEKIEALFAQALALGAIQLKAATVMFQANANREDLHATAEKLEKLGVKIWKIDQYYHVDKPDHIRDIMSIDDGLYNNLFAEMKDSYPNIKVIGVGAEFKRNQRNFMISPMGNAFVNYEGKSRKLGNFVGNQKELFQQYHSPLPVDNYTILH